MPVQTRFKTQTQQITSISEENRCKMNNGQNCLLGQSCIVDRRLVGDWVHEDDIFDKYSLPRRVNCYQPYSKEQNQAIQNEMQGYHLVENHQQSIYDRWNMDAEIERDHREQMDYD